MKTLTMMLLALAVTVGGTSTGHTITLGSVAKKCFHAGKTYACPEAFTSVSFSEIQHLEAVNVSALFGGPSYSTSKSKHSVLVLWLPSTWTAKVAMQQVCAHAGIHNVVGSHFVTFQNGAGSSQPVFSNDFFQQLACDCGGSPP